MKDDKATKKREKSNLDSAKVVSGAPAKPPIVKSPHGEKTGAFATGQDGALTEEGGAVLPRSPSLRKGVKKVNKNAEQGHKDPFKKKKKPKPPENGNNNQKKKTLKKPHEHKDAADYKDPNNKKKKPKQPKSGDNNQHNKTKKKPHEQKDPVGYMMSQHLGSDGVEVEQPKASVVIANHSFIEVDRPGEAGNNEEKEENEHVPLGNLRRSGSTYSRRKLSFSSDVMESLMDEDLMGGLVFENIELEVGRGSHSKKILHKISGQVKPGHTLALMGPSGAG
jgi:hypothetical protein